jgi:hypothetical protein
VENGVTLCKRCHKKVTGKEVEFEHVFQQIVNNKSSNVLRLLMLKYKEEDGTSKEG